MNESIWPRQPSGKTLLSGIAIEAFLTIIMDCLEGHPRYIPIDVDLMSDINPHYLQKYSSEEKVRDFIAGMTDDFFLKQAESIGCRIPEKK